MKSTEKLKEAFAKFLAESIQRRTRGINDQECYVGFIFGRIFRLPKRMERRFK